ncbi:MAG: hypothetical protein JNJ88_20050, partial [Planctomycetes bacterium]|nr:hypothetical protein [Planctomycetota bacterium]
FDRYVAMGAGRNYRQLSSQLGISKRSIVRHATRHGWQQRLSLMEQEAQKVAQGKLTEALAAVHERHLKSVRFVQMRAIEALKALPLDRAIDAVRALSLAQREERELLTEPQDRPVATLERRVREEYQKWTVTVPSTASGAGGSRDE